MGVTKHFNVQREKGRGKKQKGGTGEKKP